MKRIRMTVHEFGCFLRGIDITSISFDSSLQDWYDPASSAQLRLVFQEIAVFEHPDSIYLRGASKDNVMAFHNADYIYLENKQRDGSFTVRIVSHAYTGSTAREVTVSIR